MHDYGAPHNHPHDHDHDHRHDDMAEVKALLSYMLHHNEHHTEELLEVCDRLEALGSADAAAAGREAAAAYKAGNQALEQALAKL